MNFTWMGNRKMITTAFALAMAILVLIVALTYHSTTQLIQAQVSLQHNHRVLEGTQQLLSELEDAETGQRGYLITGEEPYLEPYLAAVEEIRTTMKEMHDLLKQDPDQQRDLMTIERLKEAKLAELRQTIDLRRKAGFDAAKQIVQTNVGKQTMDDIRKYIAGMDDRAEKSLNIDQQLTETAARRSIRVVLLGGVVTVVLLLSTFILLRNEIAVRTSAEEKVSRLNEGLKRGTAELEAKNKELGAFNNKLEAEIGGRKLAEEQLRAQTIVLQQQASLLDIAHDSIIVRDLNGLISFWNQGAEATYGWRKDQAVGHLSHTVLQTKFPQPLDEINAAMLHDGLWEGELDHARRDGSRIIVLSRWVLQRDEQGRPARVLETNNDITERKRAEDGIRRLNADLERRGEELEASNKELEAFTYSVAHDLRAPLRHIDGFSKLLLEECGAELSGENKRYLSRICDGTNRMGQLVDDLLNLARLGRRELSLQVTGLNSIVEDVLKDVKAENANRDIQWNIQPLPFVECDPALVRQVFSNLLSNAAKYSRPRKPATIEVSQMNAGGLPVILVRDNGVGFSMKYADKLFGVFQRLHRPEDFEGTGVGLASVHRIVRKHGGRVWAEAELDKGATFFFTLGTQKTESTKQTAESGKTTEKANLLMIGSEQKAA